MDRKTFTIVLVNKEDTVSDEELIEFLSRDFVKYQIPKDYVYIEVPKTSVGKFEKKRLEDCLPKENLLKQNSWGLNKHSPHS
jgi:fatty-acyl-CoA synthase